MSKPPIKRGGPRKPARSDARGAAPRASRPRRDDAGQTSRDDAPRKRFAKPEGGADKPVRKPRAAESFFGKRRDDGERPARFGEKSQRPAHADDKRQRPARLGKEGGFAPRLRKPRDEAPRHAPAPQTAPDPDKPLREGDRIAKVMARAGLCSRRDAEIWIAEGRVAVNGRVLDTANVVVGENDRITVDGHPLAKRERTRLFLFNKPRGLVATDRDPEGRPTIFEAMPPDLPRVVSIGRLDINTEGLLLLTNDGGLARVLELPSTGWLRRYRVRAHGATDQSKLDALRLGVSVDGVDYAGVEASLDRVQGDNVWLTMGLREGKNREVKRILEHLGLAVNRLIRVSYGPFHLGDLPEGAVEEVRSRHLRDQLGPQLAAEAGVDFDSPLIERDEAEERVEPRRRVKWRDEEGEAESPRKRKPPPGKRPHVSALRAGRAAEKERMRSERSQTEDRHGRVVAVERRLRAEGEAPKRKGPARIAGERRAEAGRDLPRGPRDAGRPATGRARMDREPPARRSEDRPRRFEGEGAPRPRRFEDGEARRGERAYGAVARGPRPDGGARLGRPRGEGFEGRGGGDRPRFAGGERPRAARGDGPGRGEGTYRTGGDAARAPRGAGAGGGWGKGPRAEGGERQFRDRAPGGKSFGGKSFGGKSFGGKPAGRGFGDRPEGGKAFGGKPAGGRPTGPRGAGKPGGKSFGGKPFGGKPGPRGPKRG